MSYGISGPSPAAAPPPPPTKRRSSWSSWWKPVKATEAASRYSYYESDKDSTTSSRPGSRSSSKSSSSRRRFSLSFWRSKSEDVLGKDALPSNEVPSTARKQHVGVQGQDDNGDSNGGAGGTPNGKRKTISR
jgi:hypothetical protein